MSTKISAVICTYKRADYLRVALQSLCEQTLPRDRYEILVIDNAGESETKNVVDEFRGAKVQLRYLVENQVGLSHARNKGLAEARGKHIAYLDDDARAAPQWLEALVATFEKTDAAAIGGRVWLDWDGEKPIWVSEEQLPVFTFIDHGADARALGDAEYLVGANMAFAREALKAVGGFDVRLGRQGSLLLSGEEAKVVGELRNRGAVIYYEPSALVWHSVHPSRKRPSWLLRRMFWDGASQPLLDSGPKSRRALLRAVLGDLRQCLGWSGKALVATLGGSKHNAWHSLLGLSQRAGRVRSELRLLTAAQN